ncbi:unnamed protein product [Lampetra fluviatilis]
MRPETAPGVWESAPSATESAAAAAAAGKSTSEVHGKTQEESQGSSRDRRATRRRTTSAECPERSGECRITSNRHTDRLAVLGRITRTRPGSRRGREVSPKGPGAGIPGSRVETPRGHDTDSDDDDTGHDMDINDTDSDNDADATPSAVQWRRLRYLPHVPASTRHHGEGEATGKINFTKMWVMNLGSQFIAIATGAHRQGPATPTGRGLASSIVNRTSDEVTGVPWTRR